jgi:hypothetical protein
MPEFTIKKAIEIQTQQLKEWAVALKPEVHQQLTEWATEKNHLKKRANDIIRGCRLTNFICNYPNGYTPPN